MKTKIITIGLYLWAIFFPAGNMVLSMFHWKFAYETSIVFTFALALSIVFLISYLTFTRKINKTYISLYIFFSLLSLFSFYLATDSYYWKWMRIYPIHGVPLAILLYFKKVKAR